MAVNLLKFKRGNTNRAEIIGRAHLLGLSNEPAELDADCCFIENGWFSFGYIGSPKWGSQKFQEISEEEFMNLKE